MRVMQTCGRYESLIDWNRTVAAALGSGSARHRYIETWSGHDWGAWSGTLVDGLTHLFGTDEVSASPADGAAAAVPTIAP